MKNAAAHRGVYATIAHRKVSGEVSTASFDAASPASALENVALLLEDWNADEDDTTVIRIMSSTPD